MYAQIIVDNPLYPLYSVLTLNKEIQMAQVKRHFRLEAVRQEIRAKLAAEGWRKFCVVMESWEGKCKRVARHAASAEQAMADAQMQCPGWIPVGVE
jgi:hypothetical protein